MLMVTSYVERVLPVVPIHYNWALRKEQTMETKHYGTIRCGSNSYAKFCLVLESEEQFMFYSMYKGYTGVVGYIYEGDCVCTNCIDEDDLGDYNEMYDPIFVGSEWDEDLVCCVCHEVIEGVIILGLKEE
jgi:hypothetical protein